MPTFQLQSMTLATWMALKRSCNANGAKCLSRSPR